ncbi:MAG: CBS domain-containing protein [Wenzhouxiangella sp.]|jgi:CBS domain-containing protein|nr:CBS domain-containing protein [Wenzhouxiangella sp.]MDR9452924.1 CBS domain-containing protein [Wenzhouxiangella sp.]
MHNIRHILSQKGDDIWSVESTQTVYNAVRTMAELGVGALMVIDDGQLVGMFSERDYARKVILEGRASRETPVSEVMSSPIVTIHPQATAQEGLALMTQKRFRHLPVVDDNGLLGLVSIGDLVNAVIDDQQALIAQLERYVSGQ